MRSWRRLREALATETGCTFAEIENNFAYGNGDAPLTLQINAKLRAELETLRQSHQWRPMSEAPRDGTEVLLLFSDGVRSTGNWLPLSESWDNNYCTTDEEPGDAKDDDVWIVSWLPLPPIPTKDPDHG